MFFPFSVAVLRSASKSQVDGMDDADLLKQDGKKLKKRFMTCILDVCPVREKCPRRTSRIDMSEEESREGGGLVSHVTRLEEGFRNVLLLR